MILITCLLWLSAGGFGRADPATGPHDFVATKPDAGSKAPLIVLGRGGAVRPEIKASPAAAQPYAVRYLWEALGRMTGKVPELGSDADLSQGIVLVLLQDAPAEIREDTAVRQALGNTGKDVYNHREAYYVRTEAKRVLVVANSADGLNHGAVELLESVGYEVLGMGPNWTHVPDFRSKPLVFNLEKAGRPGLYQRKLWATSGQDRGVGTLLKVFDPADEPVGESYQRWLHGTRMAGESMERVGGHSMQNFHRAVSDRMRASQTTEGFLNPNTVVGLDARRPAAVAENKGHLWINADPDSSAVAGNVYLSDGKSWVLQKPQEYHANLDLSVPMVREVVLDGLKRAAEKHFEKRPGDFLVFGADPEDGGGYARVGEQLRNKDWYPDYLKQEGVAFGQPYQLDGVKGLRQAMELWDSRSASDNVFGFGNWLCREYDKWIDSLPPDRRVTKTGQDKKKLLCIGLLSYNYYDVPPNFNLDQRIRVKISSFPKHRGTGKWEHFQSGEDMAAAFRALLPRSPSSVGWYLSLALYSDGDINRIRGSSTPEAIRNRVARAHEAGFQGIGAEMDFNFGKLGLEYYLYAKMLWNPRLTADELSALRDRWLERSFGSGWREMRQYYDFMAPPRYRINAPNNWARAIRLIDAADRKIDGGKEPDAKRRLDDLKQYWYFYYLVDTGENTKSSRPLKEFAWKGQMSYTTAMYMVTRRFLDTKNAAEAAGPEFNTGPAHYTRAETEAWWRKILDRWQVVPVSDFAQAVLSDGTKARDVDLNDLVPVGDFRSENRGAPFYYNGPQNSEIGFLTFTAKPGQEIGFQLFWNWTPDNILLRARDIDYGISRWDVAAKEWVEVVDRTMTSVRSELVRGDNDRQYQRATARYAAAIPGAYRVDVGMGGLGCQLASLDYDPVGKTDPGARAHTYFANLSGHTQSPAYFYIPKGTKSLDLEVWDSHAKKQLTLCKGLMKTSRVIDVGARGTHVVKLEPGEDGNLASFSGSGLHFPYLYSIPNLWAKAPAALLVPRAIAQADGLLKLAP